MASEGKIALIIVEGSSDQHAFKKCLDAYFKNVKNDLNIDCEVYKTDIRLHEFQKEDIVPVDNIYIDDLKKRISDSVKGFFNDHKSYSLTEKDLIAIAVLTDLDACYCKPSDVVSIPSENRKYLLDTRQINAKNVPHMLEVNRWKKEANEMLNSIENIDIDGTLLPFRCFYQSINLEHITSNNPNIDDEDIKDDNARDFRKEYKNNLDGFKALLDSLSVIGDDYASSWNSNSLQEKSFEKMTNIKYFIDWILEISANTSFDNSSELEN